MKKVVIGIASQEDIHARARAIARGEHRSATGEPKICSRPCDRWRRFCRTTTVLSCT